MDSPYRPVVRARNSPREAYRGALTAFAVLGLIPCADLVVGVGVWGWVSSQGTYPGLAMVVGGSLLGQLLATLLGCLLLRRRTLGAPRAVALALAGLVSSWGMVFVHAAAVRQLPDGELMRFARELEASTTLVMAGRTVAVATLAVGAFLAFRRAEEERCPLCGGVLPG